MLGSLVEGNHFAHLTPGPQRKTAGESWVQWLLRDSHSDPEYKYCDRLCHLRCDFIIKACRFCQISSTPFTRELSYIIFQTFLSLLFSPWVCKPLFRQNPIFFSFFKDFFVSARQLMSSICSNICTFKKSFMLLANQVQTPSLLQGQLLFSFFLVIYLTKFLRKIKNYVWIAMLPTSSVQVFPMQEALSALISWSLLTITGLKRFKDSKTCKSRLSC